MTESDIIQKGRKMKIKLIVAVVILTLVVMACGTAPAVNTYVAQPTQVPLPTYTPYPTQRPLPTMVPPTEEPERTGIDTILLNKGFRRDSYQCPSEPCNSYTYHQSNVLVSALTYADGGFVLGAPLGSGYDSGGAGTIVGEIIIGACGQNVLLWVTSHMEDTQNGKQAGTVEGYRILMGLIVSDVGVTWINIVIAPPDGLGYGG
jgi:hypothetical protein